VVRPCIDSSSEASLIKLFEVYEATVDPIRFKAIFDDLDEEMAMRTEGTQEGGQGGSLRLEHIIQILKILYDHNVLCPKGYEINLSLFMEQAQDLIGQNLPSLSKEDFIITVIGYASSGMLEEFPDLLQKIEDNQKQRLATLSMSDAVVLLKIFSQAQVGSGFFFKRLEKYIGVNADFVEASEFFLIVKSFSIVSQFIPDYDVNKIFLKLQRVATKNYDSLSLDNTALIMREYAVNDIKATSLFQACAFQLDSRVNSLSLDGFTSALFATKFLEMSKLDVFKDLSR